MVAQYLFDNFHQGIMQTFFVASSVYVEIMTKVNSSNQFELAVLNLGAKFHVTLTTPSNFSQALMLVGCTTALSKNGFETLRFKSKTSMC